MSAANHRARASRRQKHAVPAKTWCVATCVTCLVERPARKNGMVLPHLIRTSEPPVWCGGYGERMGFGVREVSKGEWDEAVKR